MNTGHIKNGGKITSKMALFFCKALYTYLKRPDIRYLQRSSCREAVYI
jgi:hypothetical protein